MTAMTDTVKGLHDLADFIEAHPDLNWSYLKGSARAIVGDKESFAEFAAIPGGWEKDAYGDESGGNFTITRKFGPVEFQVITSRNQVCERVVVATEMVAVPDPEALAAVPHTFVEREIVEWKCNPILGAAA